MGTVNLGRVGFVPKGEYAAATAYKKYDIVSYNGSNYVAQVACTGVTPGTDNTKWKLFIDNTAAINATTAANNAASAATAAAATAENAVALIASAYAPPYEEGDYCTNNGALYRANIDIPEGEAWTAAHWTEVDAMDEVADLKNQFDSYFTPRNLAENVNYTSSYYVDYRNGTNKAGSSYRAFTMVDITGCEKIVYTRLYTTNSTSYAGIAFFDENETFIENSGIPSKFNQGQNKFVLETAVVPEGAKYVRCSGLKTMENIRVYDEAEYNATMPNRMTAVEDGIAATNANIESIKTYTINSVSKDGYLRIDPAKWVRGEWDNYSTPASKAFRVRCTETLVFDRPVVILADYGFRVVGFYSTGGSFSGVRATIPANTPIHIYSRRYTDDTTETADITEFSQAIKFSTALAPIELYKPTFTDVSMFERMGVGGDSYAAGGGIISGITPLTWCKNLQRQAGITVDIYAKSGTTVMQWVSTTGEWGLQALLAGPECGLYWLQHGINGTSTAAELGTPADMEADPVPNTFYGKYHEAVEAIKAAYPKARIVLATITGTGPAMAQDPTTQYTAANNAIRAIATKCEVPCVEILDDAFFWSWFYAKSCTAGAGTHTTAMGNAGMAMAYRRLISKCIQENADYFINYKGLSE